MYNIDLANTSFAQNCSHPDNNQCAGTPAGSYAAPRGKYYYNPPCSSGPGVRWYNWTVYALSQSINITDVYIDDLYVLPSDDHSDDVNNNGFLIYDLMYGMQNITLDSATMSTYTSSNTGGL
eukprot:gene25681-32166_t